MSISNSQGVKPWLDYSNWAIAGKGTTREGKEIVFYAPPSKEVSEAWKDDPEYQAWTAERAADLQKKIDQIEQDRANGLYKGFVFHTSNGDSIHLNMQSEGTNKLTAEQLAYFKQKYGSADDLTYDLQLQMYAELANLGVIHSRVAFNEIHMASSPTIYDYESGLTSKFSSNNIDELLKLIMDRYNQENHDLNMLRSSNSCDLLIEQSQSKYVEGLNNLHNILSSIFDREG